MSMRSWIVVVALVAGCRDKPAPAPAPATPPTPTPAGPTMTHAEVEAVTDQALEVYGALRTALQAPDCAAKTTAIEGVLTRYAAFFSANARIAESPALLLESRGNLAAHDAEIRALFESYRPVVQRCLGKDPGFDKAADAAFGIN